MLISSMIGIDLRVTMDMDTTLKGQLLNIENLNKILNEIIQIDSDDEIKFRIINISSIREDSEYGGYRISFESIFDKMRVMFKIDITTGDTITPREVIYNFKLMFTDRKISILAYNIETVIAEKFEAIISKNVVTTRARDFYDIYILFKLRGNNINKDILPKAIIETARNRKTLNEYNDRNQIIKKINESDYLKEIWKEYKNKYTYAKDIEFYEVLEVLDYVNKLLIDCN